jgi:hypothetical protein
MDVAEVALPLWVFIAAGFDRHTGTKFKPTSLPFMMRLYVCHVTHDHLGNTAVHIPEVLRMPWKFKV